MNILLRRLIACSWLFQILYHRPGNEGETAFEIAKAAGQSLQMVGCQLCIKDIINIHGLHLNLENYQNLFIYLIGQNFRSFSLIKFNCGRFRNNF